MVRRGGDASSRGTSAAQLRQEVEALQAEVRRLEGEKRALQESRESDARREKDAAIGRLAAGVAHELRNPLAVILGRVQLLRMTLRGEAPPGRQELEKAFTTVEQQGLRLAKIVDTLSAVSHHLPPDLAPQDVDRLVREALDFMREQVSVDWVEVLNEIPPSLPRVLGDRAQLHQALVNVLVNAVEAMAEGGRLRITAGVEGQGAGQSVFISISDTGPGIPQDQVGRIFEPFFTTRAGRTGLGLSVVQHVLEAHRGTIHVGSEAGGGSRFTLTLPTAPERWP